VLFFDDGAGRYDISDWVSDTYGLCTICHWCCSCHNCWRNCLVRSFQRKEREKKLTMSKQSRTTLLCSSHHSRTTRSVINQLGLSCRSHHRTRIPNHTRNTNLTRKWCKHCHTRFRTGSHTFSHQSRFLTYINRNKHDGEVECCQQRSLPGRKFGCIKDRRWCYRTENNGSGYFDFESSWRFSFFRWSCFHRHTRKHWLLCLTSIPQITRSHSLSRSSFTLNSRQNHPSCIAIITRSSAYPQN
jgi:hypothetical protein